MTKKCLLCLAFLAMALLSPSQLRSDDEVLDILRDIETSQSNQQTQKPSNQERAPHTQTQQKKSSPTQQRPKTSSQSKPKRKAPPAKMPYDDMYVGDRIQGPFYVVRNNWVGDHYWVHLSTPHHTRLRDFVVRSPQAIPVGSSFNSGILMEKFLNTFFLNPYD